MKISTEINSAATLLGSNERAVELVGKAGFDAWDFSLNKMCLYDGETRKLKPNDHPLAGNNYIVYARQLKQIGLDNGIVCNQAHAPAPTYCVEIRSFLKRAIECTMEAGGEICVIHPDNYASAEQNAEMYLELLPFAKECGVKIATENMYGWDSKANKLITMACGTEKDFLAHLNAVNDDYFVACLDIGHAEMFSKETSAVTMINALGSRLKALHIHDNDKCHDNHQIPFSMRINYVPIVNALKQINYDGYLTLEAYSYLNRFDRTNAFEGIKDLAASAKKISSMFK